MSKVISCTCGKDLFILYDMGGYIKGVCTNCSTEVVVSSSVKIEILNSKKQVIPEKSNNLNLTNEEKMTKGNFVQMKIASWFAKKEGLELAYEVEVEAVTEKAMSFILNDQMQWIPKMAVEEIEVLKDALENSEKPSEGWGKVSEGDVPF